MTRLISEQFKINVVDANNKKAGINTVLVNKTKQGIVWDVTYKGSCFYPSGYSYLYELNGETINEFIGEEERRIFISTDFSRLLED